MSKRSSLRFLSAVGAVAAATAPLLGFYLGVVAGVSAGWWLGATLSLGVTVGLRYRRRKYSLARLWRFAAAVWTGSFVVALGTLVAFRVSLTDVRELEPTGRIFVAGLAFVAFAVVYGASYRRSYLESTDSDFEERRHSTDSEGRGLS
jgi:hypothetical protein